MVEQDAVRVKRTRAPKAVGLSALGLGGESGNLKVKDAYVGGAKLLFSVPKHAGLGAHWKLDDDEADDLGGAIAAFVKTLPASQRKKWEKKLEKYWPGLNLLVVAGMITVPRVMVTQELARMARAQTPSPSPDASLAGSRPYPSGVDLRDVVERNAPSSAQDATSGGAVSAG